MTMAEKEYIEREVIIRKLNEIGGCDASDEWDKVWDMAIDTAVKAVERLPVAYVAPVKHGHFRRLTFSGDTIICSECKMAYNIFETNGAENFNFCPHCGAKIMDGGDENV